MRNEEFLVHYVEVPSNSDAQRENAANLSQRRCDIYLEQNLSDSGAALELENFRHRHIELKSVYEEEYSLHTAAKSGVEDRVAQILAEQPELARQLNRDGYTALHLACRLGHLHVVREFMRRNSKLCLVKDKHGRTPLHMATMEGRTAIMEELLRACPDSVMEVTATDETPLHIAMSHGQLKAVEFLLDWSKGRPCFDDLIGKKDSAGNTLLHMAVSRKHLQTIKFLVDQKSTSVNAVNNSCFTALDIFDALPHENKDTEIEKIFGRAGALPANELLAERKLDCTNDESHMTKSQRKWYQSFHLNGYDVSLVAATLIATASFLATFFSPRLKLDEGYQSSHLRHLFVLFDSIAFVTSTALMIIILVRELPLKPWLLVSVFSMFGAFTCSIKAISPGDALPITFVGSFTLLAAVSEYLSQQFRNLLLSCLRVCRDHASEFIKDSIASAQRALYTTHSCCVLTKCKHINFTCLDI